MIINPYSYLSFSTIYKEDFESSAHRIGFLYKFPVGWTDPGSPYIPTNEWTVYYDNGVEYPLSNTVPGGSGGKSLVFTNNGTDPNSVTTKSFSTVGYTGITLNLLQYRVTGAPSLTIEWSDDNSTWSNTGFVDVTDDGVWHAASTVNLPVGAENKPNIYLRLSTTADDNGQFGVYFVVDDITIKGTS